jgi:outer membrane receptor protein involved in Fe transport
MDKDKRPWTEIAEYASLAGSALGTLVAPVEPSFNNPGETTTDFIPSWLNLDLSDRIPVTRNIGLIVYLENLADVTYEKENRIYQPGLTFRIGLESSF